MTIIATRGRRVCGAKLISPAKGKLVPRTRLLALGQKRTQQSVHRVVWQMVLITTHAFPPFFPRSIANGWLSAHAAGATWNG